MKRGEIYRVDLASRSGAEQTGRRPVIVVSRDAFNLAPGAGSDRGAGPHITSASKERPYRRIASRGIRDLPWETVALRHQVTTLDRARLPTNLAFPTLHGWYSYLLAVRGPGPLCVGKVPRLLVGYHLCIADGLTSCCTW